MEQPYPIFNPHSDDELLRGWLVHAHKCRDRHDFAARHCDTLRYAIGVPAITLSAIVGTSVFSALSQNQEQWMKLLVVFLSVAAAVFAALQTFMDYPARAERHRAAAAKYKGLIHEFEQALWPEHRLESRDAKLISGLRDRLAEFEESMPVVPQHIYNQVEKRYGSFKFVSSALELVTPRRAENSTGRAVPVLPADDLQEAKDFYATKLGFRVLFEASDDGKRGLLGLARGTIRITVDSPMDGHGRNVCVSLEVDDADAYYEEWREQVNMLHPPKNESWCARTFDLLDPFGNTIFVIGPTK